MTVSIKPVLNITAALALTAFFASCNQATPIGSAPSQAETQAVSDAISSELIASSSSLTLESGLQTLSMSDAVSAQARRACVTVNPDPVVDTDGDFVPDNATYTFDCSLTRPLFTYSTTGTLQVSDPSSDAGTWGFNSTANLTSTRTNSQNGNVLTEVRTGTRSPRKTGDSITQSHNITVNRTLAGEPKSVITNLWNLNFTATTPGSIQMGAALPAGTLSAAGNYTFARDGVTRTWTISTVSPLQYDPACDNELKTVGGTLRATLSGVGGSGFFEIVFGACGVAPVTTRSFTSAS